ncbi:MAG TPA: hypothetical protein ACFCUC_18520 [Desulfobacterales bacterium]
MARFSEDQRQTAEAMKLLIEVYYLFVESRRRECFSTPVIEKVASFLDLVIPNFRPCLYFRQPSCFRYRVEGEEITFRNEHIDATIEVFAELVASLKHGNPKWFNITGRTVERRQELDGGASISNQALSPTTEDLTGGTSPICRIIDPPPEDADHKQSDEYIALRNATLNKPPEYFESFQLSINSGAQDAEGFFLEEGDRISSPGYFKSRAGFIHVVKYLLVKYQFLFGSFERIKICNYCGKLFFEKKLGAGVYCSPLCRKRYFDALQPPEKRKCRERQNAWIRYRQLFYDWPRTGVYTLQKDDCQSCPGTVESGKCPSLIEKNKRIFEMYAKTEPQKQ